jgi:hypothetical protein
MEADREEGGNGVKVKNVGKNSVDRHKVGQMGRNFGVDPLFHFFGNHALPQIQLGLEVANAIAQLQACARSEP